MSAGDAVVQVAELAKSYGATPVLRGISLEVAAGEMTAIVGRSGSGKSTLLHVVGGLDRSYEGRVRVLGIDLASLDDRALSRFRNQRVGFVFQSFNLLDHLSCEENVALPAHFSGERRPAEARARAREALDRVGIADRAATLPSRLSGGQRQRVAIARALFHRPDLLLADEPTGNLDSETGQQIIDLFRALNRDGQTLLIVTHEERVSQAAQRVVHLDDGRVVAPASGAPL